MAKNSHPGKLTKRQAVFVAEYLVSLNATKAAVAAGYSEKTARFIGAENLTKPNIAAAIEKAMTKRAERTELTQDYVLDGIRSLVERCIQAEPVLDEKGSPTGEYRFEASAALKGYELLGKHLKLFTDKVEHGGGIRFKSLSDLTDAELSAIAGEAEGARSGASSTT